MHRNNCNTGLLWGLLEMYGNVGVVVMVCVCETERLIFDWELQMSLKLVILHLGLKIF